MAPRALSRHNCENHFWEILFYFYKNLFFWFSAPRALSRHNFENHFWEILFYFLQEFFFFDSRKVPKFFKCVGSSFLFLRHPLNRISFLKNKIRPKKYLYPEGTKGILIRVCSLFLKSKILSLRFWSFNNYTQTENIYRNNNKNQNTSRFWGTEK